MSTRTEADSVTFVGYEQRENCTVAKFAHTEPYRSYVDSRPIKHFFKNNAACEERLENLKKKGFPHEQTAKAMADWPSE